jgi:pimeloyl-ACP methyl ester carboxylesterase
MIMKEFNLSIEYILIEGIPTLSVNRGGGGGGIIHLHGSEASKETDLLLILSLADAGFWILAPDAPDHGERLLPPRRPFLKTVESVLMSAPRETAKMIAYFKKAGVEDVALSGRSLGGMLAGPGAAVHKGSRVSPARYGRKYPPSFRENFQCVGADSRDEGDVCKGVYAACSRPGTAPQGAQDSGCSDLSGG